MKTAQSQIISELKKGKLDNFSQLYDEYVEKIYRFIYYRTSNEEVVQDLTSQTFLKALDSLKKKKFKGDNFSAWIYKIAKNLLIDFYRQNKETLDLEQAWFLSDKKDLKEEVDNKMQLDKVRVYLNKLSKEQREILIMKVWDELTYKEISEIMKKNEANCKMIFSRAVKKLKQEMPLALFLSLLINL